MSSRCADAPWARSDRHVFAVLQTAILLLELGFALLAIDWYRVRGEVVGSDFPAFWTAARIDSAEALEQAYRDDLFGRDPAQYMAELGKRDPWLYPPHSLFLLWPLAHLALPSAYTIWQLATLGALGLASWAVFARSARAAAFAVMAPATLMCLVLGQSGGLAAGLLIAGMGLLGRRPVLAGVLLGLLTFKPTLGVLVPFALVAGRH